MRPSLILSSAIIFRAIASFEAAAVGTYTKGRPARRARVSACSFRSLDTFSLNIPNRPQRPPEQPPVKSLQRADDMLLVPFKKPLHVALQSVVAQQSSQYSSGRRQTQLHTFHLWQSLSIPSICGSSFLLVAALAAPGASVVEFPTVSSYVSIIFFQSRSSSVCPLIYAKITTSNAVT